MDKDSKKPKTSRFYREPSLTFNQSVVLIILCSLITGLAVNFFNSVHYSNVVSQADSQTSATQSELGKEQYDVKFLINNSNKQVNCFDLRSDYARGLCNTHNSTVSGSHP